MNTLKTLWNRLMAIPLFAKLWQFAKFGIVGLSNTIISLIVYEILVQGFGCYYLLANAIGLIISVINAYYWNNRCVFGDGQKKPFAEHVRMYFRSLTAYGGAFVLDSLLLILWVEVVGLPETIAPVLNLCITIPLNFLVNKYWTFRKKR